MRFAAAAVAFVTLSGCASPIGNAIISAASEAVGASDTPAATAAAAPRINRAAIKEADVAAIYVSSADTGAFAVTVAVAKRRDGITYISNERRSVVMRGGLAATTRGFGANLQAVQTADDDPLVNETPAALWPDTTRRTYLFAGQGPDFVPVTARCRVAVAEPVTLDVLGVDRTGDAVVEVCRTDTGLSFSNQHIISPSNGKIWVSNQWTGPIQGMLTLQVIEQFEDS